MRKIVCAGAGIIGRSWALAFAGHGFEVCLYDTDAQALDFAINAIEPALTDLESAGMVADAGAAFKLIHTSVDLAQAIEGAEYLQESLPEDLSIKRQLYVEVDAIVASTGNSRLVCGSSVSGLPASGFMGGLGISSRCLVAHPTNPPHLTPLTELFATEWTSSGALDYCRELLEEIGQVPVLIKKEILGYVLNRLQSAVIGESLHLVAEDVISPEDLEKVMRFGLGPRWALMGPFMTGHLNAQGGYLDYMTKFEHSYRADMADLKVNYPWTMATIRQVHQALSQEVPVEKVLEGQQWRDRRLMAWRKSADSDRSGKDYQN